MLTIALTALTALASPAQDFGDYHALVIGNEKYEHLRDLETAIDDAKAVSKLLREDYGFDVQEMHDATRREIEDALWGYADRLKATDNLLVYFAGHGEQDKRTSRGYWLGVDADSTPRRWLSNETIRDTLEATKAKHVLLVSDSCFSGSLTRSTDDIRGLRVDPKDPERTAKLARRKARLVLTSGGEEPVSDEGPDGHSVFAHAFLTALRRNRGVLAGYSMFPQIKGYVELNSPTRQVPAYVPVRECGHDFGDFLFVRKRGATPAPKPGPLKGPVLLLRGQIDQASFQVATIRIEGDSADNRIFGSESFFLPVATEAVKIVLIAEVDGEERVRRTLDTSGSHPTEPFQGRDASVHDFGRWRIPTLPIYVEGQLQLPSGVKTARIQLANDLSTAEEFDRGFHVLERSQGSGAFRLILPDTGAGAELTITADGCKDSAVALRLDRTELGYRGSRRARVLNLGRVVLEPTRSAVSASLDALKERAQYEKLDKVAVEALAHAAEARWTAQFAGLTYERVERFSAGGKSHWVAIWTHRKTGLEFVLVPGGRFQMGSPASEPDRGNDERQHWVTLDPFLIGRSQCTQEAWAKVAGSAGLVSDPSHFDGPDRLPVETVSAEDVDIWCREADLQLPTEAQWEFACRAGTTAAYTFGSNLSSSQAWINKNLQDGPAPVGSFSSSAFGLFDVHGNVWEWCRDIYLDYDTRPEKGTGLRPGSSAYRVLRGGGFLSTARDARSALRRRYEPGYRVKLVGFRPSLDLPW